MHMKKISKIVVVLLAVAMLFTVTGCGSRAAIISNDDPVVSTDQTPDATPTGSEEVAAEPAEQAEGAAEEPSEEPADDQEPDVAPEQIAEEPAEPIAEQNTEPENFINVCTSKILAIAKQPGGIDIMSGDDAEFTSNAKRADKIEWRFVAPDYKSEIVWNDAKIASVFPGMVCSKGDTSKFSVEHIPMELNGWYVVALFTDINGDMIASSGAMVSVTDSGYVPVPIEPAEEQQPAVVPAPIGNASGEHTHSYIATVVAPTCKSGGYTLHTCSCGDTYQDKETRPLGHKWEVRSERIQTGSEIHDFCASCGQDMYGWTHNQVNAHLDQHLANGDPKAGNINSNMVPIYITVTTYTCLRCGAEK